LAIFIIFSIIIYQIIIIRKILDFSKSGLNPTNSVKTIIFDVSCFLSAQLFSKTAWIVTTNKETNKGKEIGTTLGFGYKRF